MTKYGMRLPFVVKILSLKTVYNWKGGVNPPFQITSLQRHLQASDSVPIFRGPHGNSASLIWRNICVYSHFQMPQEVILLLLYEGLYIIFWHIYIINFCVKKQVQPIRKTLCFLRHSDWKFQQSLKFKKFETIQQTFLTFSIPCIFTGNAYVAPLGSWLNHRHTRLPSTSTLMSLLTC